jgi:hypothetical protein
MRRDKENVSLLISSLLLQDDDEGFAPSSLSLHLQVDDESTTLLVGFLLFQQADDEATAKNLTRRVQTLLIRFLLSYTGQVDDEGANPCRVFATPTGR